MDWEVEAAVSDATPGQRLRGYRNPPPGAEEREGRRDHCSAACLAVYVI